MIHEKRIDFNQLAKPANLQNSAVLRMLEEEDERKRSGKPVIEDNNSILEVHELTTAEVRRLVRPRSRFRECWPPLCPQDGRHCQKLFCPASGLKRVAWPPPPEDQDYANFVEQGPVQVKTRGVGEYADYQSKSPSLVGAGGYIGGQQSPQPQPQYQPQPQARPQPLSPQPQPPKLQQQQSLTGLRQPSQFQPSQQPIPKTWAPVNWGAKPQAKPQSPQPVHVPIQVLQTPPPVQSPQIQAPLPQAPWLPQAQAPVRQVTPVPIFKTWNEKPQVQIQQSPLSPIQTWHEKPQPQYQPQPFSTWNDQHQAPLTVTQDHQSPQSYQQLQSTPAHFEPPPAIITLRPEPPISQKPAPVYQAQPAAINPNSGSMRGDQKWPPASVKEQTEAENQARIELAKGPVFRPRRVAKDYRSFFAQHALTNTYPGYRAPPGTQYFTPAYQH